MAIMPRKDIADFLEESVRHYNRVAFIENDPVSIPHLFTKKEDREISGFFAAVLAWGNRKTIIRNASRLMEQMDGAPYEFVMHHTTNELNRLAPFVHRTFNGGDCMFFIRSLRNIYRSHQGMEHIFTKGFRQQSHPAAAIHEFRKVFFMPRHELRTEKHLGDPYRNSASKRICMFLRWMVRTDRDRVDFGLWKQIQPGQLAIPLDVHTARVARALGLLRRKTNDWKAVMELTNALRQLDPADPVKYDFALFGMGVNERRGKAGW